MDLGLSQKALAWIRVASLTFGAVYTAYQGFASDDWINGTEWMSLFSTAIMTFLASVSGAPKDAREPLPMTPERAAAIQGGAAARGSDK